MTRRLPPFKVDYNYLRSATDGLNAKDRRLSPSTIQMCIAALDAMQFNRYWYAGDGNLTDYQVEQKNELVHKAIFELLERVPLHSEGITQSAPGQAGDCEKRGSEHMIIYLGGEAYLIDDCGCGTKFFRLSEVKPTIDGQGQITLPGKTIAEDDVIPFNVGGDYLDCYASRAVPLILGYAGDYHSTLVDAAVQGLDFISNIDELVDSVAIVAAWLQNDTDISDWVNLATNSVRAAFEDATYQATMEELWQFEGEVTRTQLTEWARSGPGWVNNIPVKWLLVDYIQYSRINNVNNQLRLIADGCANGNEYPQTSPTLAEYQEWEYNGNVYPFWQYFPAVTLTHGTGTFQYVPPVTELETNAIGMFCKGAAVGAGNWVWAEVVTGTHNTNQWRYPTNGVESMIAGNAEAIAALEAFTGEQANSENNGDTYGWGVRVFQNDGVVSYRVDHVVIVGAAL